MKLFYKLALVTFPLFLQQRSLADVTLSSAAVAAASIAQGSTGNVVYIVKVDVTVLPVTMDHIQFTFTGTHISSDLTTLNVYYNPTSPTVSGASLMASNIPASFASPHAYNVPFNYSGSQTITAGASGYFIITVNVNSIGTNGNTVKLNGLANPVVFLYTTVPTVVNNQTDAAGVQTIQAAGVTLSTITVAASNIAQGSTGNVVYIVKMDVTALPVTMDHIQFTFTGTHISSDLTTLNVYYNPTAPTVSGASLMANGISAAFAAPHAYNVVFNVSGSQTIAAGATGYFIITVNVSATATNGNTVKVDGAAYPVSFSYTTAPTVTNNQTDAAGVQTIQAAGVTLSSVAVAAANLPQGSTGNVVYIAKMDVTGLPVTMNHIQFTFTGTHIGTDLTTLNVYYNPTAPTVSGASLMANGISAAFAAPHAYNVVFNVSGSQTIAAGATGYFIITVNVSATATNGNTVKVDGAAYPVSFSYTTAPTVTNNQTDVAGVQTIQAAGVTLSSITVAAASLAQGSINNIVYIAKIDVTTLPVVASYIQFTLDGTYNSSDLSNLSLYYNATAPNLSGASLLANNIPTNFSPPHAYNAFFNILGSQTIAAGATGYFIITVNISSTATNGNTVKINGATNPISFTYTTSPTVTNNQTDAAGVQTIQAAGVTLSSITVAAASLAQGSINNIVYIAKIDVTTLPVVASYIQFTLDGTYNSSDLSNLSLYYNATAPNLSGASLLANNIPTNFSPPHAYNAFFNILGSQTIAAGATGYFIITVNISPTATNGNTVKINGATNPISFTYSTAPTVTNNQTDAAGTQTILASGVTVSSITFPAANIARSSIDNIVYAVKMDVTALPVVVNHIVFTLTGTYVNTDFTVLNVYYNPTSPNLSGSSLMAQNIPANFSSPHTYNLAFTYSGNQPIAAGVSGYFIITVNVAAAATLGNTVKLDGAANPVSFGYTTAPTIVNNQTDAAGAKTIVNVLPLTLLDFSGNVTNTQQAHLQWLTARELNTKDFEVEWSTDGQQFNTIAIILAANNSTENRQYSYLHKLAFTGNNFYRLKMIDIDGRFTYSQIIKLNITTTIDKITLYPNPVVDLVKVQVQAVNDETLVLKLYDAAGRIIKLRSFNCIKGNNSLSWNLQDLPSGQYFISSENKTLEAFRIFKD